ncbi:MAG: M55 family metallopeptidase [Anaerolineae bacterium]
MRVIVGTDVEGVAGVVSFDAQAFPDGRYFEAARKLTTGEVNAAIEALVSNGVDDILVEDGHGVGGIVYEDLHPAATLLHGRRASNRGGVIDAAMHGYDVLIMVGQHAMAGVADANLNHTQSSTMIDYMKLNGNAIGETAQLALYHGAMGQPLIFLSGDEAACREAEQLVPGLTTAPVKKGLWRSAAVSLSQPAAHRLIRDRVAAALKRQRVDPLPPVVWPGPYVMEVRFFHTDAADSYTHRHRGRFSVERINSQTIRLASDDIRDVVFPL